MVQWLSSPESLQTLGDNDHDAAAADDDADDDDDEDDDDDDDEDDDMMTGMITMVGFARRWGCPWNPPAAREPCWNLMEMILIFCDDGDGDGDGDGDEDDQEEEDDDDEYYDDDDGDDDDSNFPFGLRFLLATFSLFLGPFLGAKKSPFLTPFAQPNQRENYQMMMLWWWWYCDDVHDVNGDDDERL